MKRLKEVPADVLDMIEEKKEVEIKSYVQFCTLPVRPVRMQMLYGNQMEFGQTIVPATSICLCGDAFLDNAHLNRDRIAYFVKGTDKAFPLAHVFSGSGTLCLGNIFVPSKISRFNPQLPLETLFLHNDRVLNHGNASLKMSTHTAQEIFSILKDNRIVLDDRLRKRFECGAQLLSDDTIWHVAETVYHTASDILEALRIMAHIYECLFFAGK